MITFFCSAKAFRSRTAIQQRNAINSWRRLYPAVGVMLFGTDEGVAEICSEYALVRCPGVAWSAVGRPGWDNWLIMDIRRRGVDLIDASRIVRPIHQNHDYSHVPHAKGIAWEGPEANRNRELALLDYPTFQPRLHSVDNASHR